MRGSFYAIVFLFIILETAVAGNYPYYAIALSFLGYVAYKHEEKSLYFAMGVAFVIGISASRIEQIILFYSIYVLVLAKLFKSILFERVNIFFITLIEVAMYITYIYFFRIKDILILNWIKEFVFVLFYNFIFYYFDTIREKKR